MNITYTKPRPRKVRKEPVRSEPQKLDREPTDLYDFDYLAKSLAALDLKDDEEEVA